ncbi:MAG TPA: hypothetical protein DEA44_01735, partial [Firmicutes bacterium]|nr:hypothetical protein [Bacillota bacterium]
LSLTLYFPVKMEKHRNFPQEKFLCFIFTGNLYFHGFSGVEHGTLGDAAQLLFERRRVLPDYLKGVVMH